MHGSSPGGKIEKAEVKMAIRHKVIIRVPKGTRILHEGYHQFVDTKRSYTVRALPPSKLITNALDSAPWYTVCTQADVDDKDAPEVSWVGGGGCWRRAKQRAVILLPQIQFHRA